MQMCTYCEISPTRNEPFDTLRQKLKTQAAIGKISFKATIRYNMQIIFFNCRDFLANIDEKVLEATNTK